MQRLFRLVDTAELTPVGTKTTRGFERSVERHGVINPIIVAEVADSDGVIGLEIVDGNRRVRAAQSAGLEKIPGIVLKETTPEDRARLTLMTNHLRSYNFHTESIAVSSLVADEREARKAADEMGLASTKLQTIQKKLDAMPDEIRRAMYEDRIPVSSATSIGGWPEPLQRQLVDLLRQRRYLDSRTIDAIRKEYEQLHPGPAKRTQFGAGPPIDAPFVEDWDADEPTAFERFVPADGAPIAQPSRAPVRPQPPPVSSPARPDDPLDGGVELGGSPGEDPPADDPRMFISHLDERLLDLARETRSHDLPRAVWIDRAMRAWDLTEPE